jgi:hypothetical protein
LTVENGDLNSGLSILNSVLTEPSFIKEAMKPAATSLGSFWQLAYETVPIVECNFEPWQVQLIWNSSVNRDTITIGVRGNFQKGAPTKRWNELGGWLPITDRRLPNFLGKKTLAEVQRNTKLLLFETPTLTPSGSEISEALLASTILGTGKECLLWRICREEMMMSYRQEAFLYPDRKGWRLRIAIATDENGIAPESISTVRDRLIKAVNELKSSDLVWAKGAARGYLQNQLQTLPMVLGVGGILSEEPADQLYLFWQAKLNRNWNPNEILESMEKVQLDIVKKHLIEMLNQMNVQLISAP